MHHFTDSTHWPDCIGSFSPTSADLASTEALPKISVLIAGIEDSLRSSQNFLLVRDCENLERQTVIQASLAELLAKSLDGRPLVEDDIREACSRALHLGRLQLGLLRRAIRSARMLSHLLESPEIAYTHVAARRSVPGNNTMPQQES